MENETKFSRLMDAEEAGKLLGVSVGTLAVWRSTNRYPLPYVKVGALVRYSEQSLLTFIAGRTVDRPRTPDGRPAGRRRRTSQRARRST